jgi:hypothetical protein
MPFAPPVIRTLLLASSVAVCPLRTVAMVPVVENSPVLGL